MEPFYIQVASELSNVLDIEEVKNEKNFEQFRKALVIRLHSLIQHDYTRLVNILYRLDIAEEDARACFSKSNIGEAAEALADAVITRQLKKAESRKKWSDSHR